MEWDSQRRTRNGTLRCITILGLPMPNVGVGVWDGDLRCEAVYLWVLAC